VGRNPSPRYLLVATGILAIATASVARAQSNADDILDNLGEAPKVKTAAEAPTVEPETTTKATSKPAAELKASDKTPPAVNIDRIKAVPRKAMLKRHRLELTPFFSMSLNDAFYQHYAASGTLVFYPHDAFGIGLGVDYIFAHAETTNLDAVRQDLVSVPAIFELPSMFAHLDAYWIPLYGKLSLFNSDIIHFDIYTVAGFGAAFAGSRHPPEANVGVGQRFVFGDWLAMRLEVRDHFFVDSQEVNGLPRSDIQNYVLVALGVSMFVPPSFDYGAQ
jgi:outer membrane beta-barrel protein